MAENVNKPGSDNSNLGKGGNSGNQSGNQKGNQSGSNIDRGQNRDEDLKKKTSTGKDLKGNRSEEDLDLDGKEGREDLGGSDKRNFDQNKGDINKGR